MQRRKWLTDMFNKIVFDVETKNTFDDVGGRDNVKDLDVSVVCAYSYEQDAYLCFDETELDKLGEFLKKARPLVGFSSKRFDVPVLNKYFNFNLTAVPHFDILEEIEQSLGRRIGLGLLAEANLGIGKTGHGLEAVELYRRGEIEKLKSYCLQDVKITKGIFDLIASKGYLWVPRRDIPQMDKVEIPYTELEEEQSSML